MNDIDAWMESEAAAEQEIKNEAADLRQVRKENALLAKMNRDKGYHIHALIEENRKLKAGTYIDRIEARLAEAERLLAWAQKEIQGWQALCSYEINGEEESNMEQINAFLNEATI